MWKKLGKIFSIKNYSNLLYSHSSYPTLEKINNFIRVYFSSRDKKNTSRVFHFDFFKENKEIFFNKKLDLNVGKTGTYNCDGVAPRSIVLNKNNEKLMYLIGWNKCYSFPYQLSIGLSFFNKNKWEDIGQILGRNKFDKIFVTSPFVIKDENKFKMWYCSCTEWKKNNPKYLIKYTESKNGIDWEISDQICIDYTFASSIGWPMVIKNKKNEYIMYFSHRKDYNFIKNKNNSYEIGKAISKNGVNWELTDLSVLKKSKYGWDSKMICYSSIVDNLMFYNGNGFGYSGIGLAELT